MTIYERRLYDAIAELYPCLDPRGIFEKLVETGIIDFSRCKILVIREHVEAQMRKGVKKIDAMWETADTFACSYEYVRKCVYYYRDINLR